MLVVGIAISIIKAALFSLFHITTKQLRKLCLDQSGEVNECHPYLQLCQTNIVTNVMDYYTQLTEQWLTWFFIYTLLSHQRVFCIHTTQSAADVTHSYQSALQSIKAERFSGSVETLISGADVDLWLHPSLPSSDFFCPLLSIFTTFLSLFYLFFSFRNRSIPLLILMHHVPVFRRASLFCFLLLPSSVAQISTKIS